MASRRANGYGSVSKINGKNLRKPWRVQVPTGERTAMGTQKRVSLGTFRTKKEAERFLDDYIEKGMTLEKYNCTLGQLYKKWYRYRERQVAAGNISKSAIDCNRAAWLKLQVLENELVRKIGTEKLQDVLDACDQSQSSKEKLKSLMVMLWDFAIWNDIAEKNYAGYVTVISLVNNRMQQKNQKSSVLTENAPINEKTPTIKGEPFNPEERKYLKEAAAAGIEWVDVILMLCYVGFRISAFLAIPKDKVLLENDKVIAVIGGNKTKAGKDNLVAVSPVVEPYFTKWYNKPGKYLISRPDGEQYTSNYWRKNCYYPALEEMNAKGWPVRMLTPHCTRHTFATLCGNAGLSEAMVTKLIGHSNYNMTKHYTHTELQERIAAINLLT